MPNIDEELFAAAKNCDATTLARLLDAHPDSLHVREPPYEWTLLHAAAHHGCLDAVNLLIARGLDVRSKEKGDRTSPMHWAAAAGHADVVQALIDAGGEVVGEGDDHELEVIGWATCWEGCDDERHRDVVARLLRAGAKHHIFSAIAMNLGDEVRRIVAADPSMLNKRLSRNENHQTPLHFAVRMNRPQMVALLLELGADPLAVDGGGQSVASYATSTEVDRPVMERIREMTLTEFDSAERGQRKPRAGVMDVVAAVSLRDWDTAKRLLADNPDLKNGGGSLHIMAKRGDSIALKWLLDHGANPDAMWTHWDADVTALHMASWRCSADAARALLEANANPKIKDNKHDGDALDWAEHFGCVEIVKLLRG
jgi:ankyrin repeat protein